MEHQNNALEYTSYSPEPIDQSRDSYVENNYDAHWKDVVKEQDRQASQSQASGGHDELKELVENEERDHCHHTEQHQQAGFARICGQSTQNEDTPAESSLTTADVYVAKNKRRKSLLSEMLFIQSMVSELVKDLQRSSLNYPGNKESTELLKITLSSVKCGLRMTRKLAHLAPVCLELEPAGIGINRGIYRTFSNEQEAILRRNFVDSGGKPVSSQIKKIATNIGAEEDRVRRWFINKRQQEKKAK